MVAPVVWFIVLAFAFTWALLPFAGSSMTVSLLALCGPAAAAAVVAIRLGPAPRQDLRDRILRWRVPIRWYAVALLVPIAASALARGIEVLLGAPASIHFMSITALQALVFVLVAGEEIGWRGFLLPRFLDRLGPWTASLVIGAIWALWHLPLFSMPAMPQYGSPFPAFVIYTVALSVLLTRLSLVTHGSVMLATLFHGAVNTFGFANGGATPFQRGWANAMAYGLVALVAMAPAFQGTHRPIGTSRETER